MARAAWGKRTVGGAVLALSVFASALLVGAWAPASSQESTDLLVSSEEVSGSGRVDLVVAPPRLLSGQEFPTRAFRVSQQGADLPIEVSPLLAGDLEVVLVLDGTLPEEATSSAEGAAVELALALPEQARIGVVSSAGRARLLGPLSTDDAATLAAIRQLAPAEGRATYDAVELALTLLSSNEGVRRTIVVLSGGSDTASAVTPDYLSQQLVATDTAVYPITIGVGDEPVDAGLVDLPSAADGRALAASSPGAILGPYDDVVAELLSQYRLSFDLRDQAPTTVEIEVAFDEVTASSSVPITRGEEDPLTTPPTMAGGSPTLAPALSGADADDGGDNRFAITVLVLGFLLEVGLIAALRSIKRRQPARAVAASPAEHEEAAVLHGEEQIIDLRERSPDVPEPVHAEPVAVGARTGLDRPEVTNGRGVALGLVSRPPANGSPGPNGGGSSGMASMALPPAPTEESAPEPAPRPERQPEVRTEDPVVLSSAAPDEVEAPAPPPFEVQLPDEEPADLPAAAERLPRHPADRSAVRFSNSVLVLAARLRGGTSLVRALRAAAAVSSRPTRMLLQRLAHGTRTGKRLSQAAAVVPLAQDWRMRWVGLAARAHESRGGSLADVLEAAAHIISERARLGRTRRRLDSRERSLAVLLTMVPIAVVVARQAKGPFLANSTSTTLGTILLGVVVLFTAAGAWWLRRVGREPLAAVPAFWRAARRRAVADQRLEDVLDRSVLYVSAGLDIDAALAQATGDVPPPLPPLAKTVRRLREQQGPSTNGDVDERQARVAAVQGETTRLRHALSRRAERQARWVAVNAALPFLTCILPATIIVAFLLP